MLGVFHAGGVVCAVMPPFRICAVLGYVVMEDAVRCHAEEKGEYCIQCRDVSEVSVLTEALFASISCRHRRGVGK